MQLRLPLVLEFSLAAIFTLLTYHVARAETEPSSSQLSIGLVLPLSGEWAFLGEGIRDGVMLAQEDLARAGVKLQIALEDNHGDLVASASAAKRLVESPARTHAVISIISGVAKVVRAISEPKKVISIGICSDLDAADGQYGFINYLTAEQGVTRYLRHLAQRGSPIPTVGIVALNEAGFVRIVDTLRQLSKDSIKIAFLESFNRGTTDFRSLVLKIRSHNPTTLLLLGLSPELEILNKQLRESKVSASISSIEAIGLLKDKSSFNDAWYVDAAEPPVEFRERFKERFGREVTPGLGHAYDSVMLLSQAFQRLLDDGEEVASENLARQFRAISNRFGVLGPLTVRSNGVIWSNAVVKKVVAGEVVTLPE